MGVADGIILEMAGLRVAPIQKRQEFFVVCGGLCVADGLIHLQKRGKLLEDGEGKFRIWIGVVNRDQGLYVIGERSDMCMTYGGGQFADARTVFQVAKQVVCRGVNPKIDHAIL